MLPSVATTRLASLLIVITGRSLFHVPLFLCLFTQTACNLSGSEFIYSVFVVWTHRNDDTLFLSEYHRCGVEIIIFLSPWSVYKNSLLFSVK